MERKNCILYDRQCTDCGECNRCDLDENKICDNCCKCINNEKNDFRTVKIDKVTAGKEEVKKRLRLKKK